MIELTLNDRLFLSFSVALGFIVAGVGNALIGPRSGLHRVLMAAAGFAAGLASTAALVPEFVGPLALVGGGGFALVFAARSRQFRRIAAAIWERPRITWGLVASAGLLLMVGEFARFDAVELVALEQQDAAMKQAVDANPFVAVDARLAKTDRGSAIQLLTAGEMKNAGQLLAAEQTTLQAAHLEECVIRRGPADDNTNCHGWVFTGGKYALLGQDVETILVDNGYTPVAAPQLGDLCVYRNEANGVAHTALVRSVFDDGTILVEGKWGRLGVFLHPVDHSVYGTHFAYYHTDRSTHLLNSIP